ncbi:MAG: HAMP domain-containing histidine kinase [Clostridiales bacterium]|nr:HAMP domain-containing histidine kinase [Clostridiales bacterium]
MTIRRQWMLVLMISAAIAVLVNSFVLSTLINRYFVGYAKVNYDQHIAQLVEFSTEALSDGDYTEQQLEMQLTSHLSDPINRIRLYNTDGELLADVGTPGYPAMGMMRSNAMNRMMGAASEEIDAIDITKSGSVIGKLIVTRYSSIVKSLGTQRFMLALAGNSVLSFGIVFALVFVLGLFISRKMSRDLTQTAQQAIDIDMGGESRVRQSRVKEIQTIQQSLEALQSRLRLKQTSRKKRIDELVHQTRTPLTILRTHLEGFRDGVIRFTPEEIQTCEAQIEHLSSIITNMSGLLDAEKEIDEAKIEPVEFSALMRQITGGLKAQFDKKSVRLQTTGQQKITLQTDRYKLSQALYNILTNAYKFTPSGGNVTIEYGLTGDEFAVSVQDTGAGIAQEDQPKIFEAYYRGRNSLDTQGDGIGLYIARENIEKLGGTILLESAPGKGSRFTIRIPTGR